MVTDYVYRASLYGGRFYTNWLGGSHIPITNGQAGILVKMRSAPTAQAAGRHSLASLLLPHELWFS